MNNLNRRDILYMCNRAYKKDIAAYLNISPSTLTRWTSKDASGKYRLKSIKTVKDYSSLIDNFRDKSTGSRPSHTRKDRSAYLDNKAINNQGFKKLSIEYDKDINSIHDYYEFDIKDSIDQDTTKSMYDLMLKIALENKDKKDPFTGAYIKLYGDIANDQGTIDKNEYLSTDQSTIQGEFGNGKLFVSTTNIKGVIQDAITLGFDSYTMKTMKKAFVVIVQYKTDKGIAPTKGEFKDGSIKH